MKGNKMTQPTVAEQGVAFSSTIGSLLGGVKGAVAAALKVATLLDNWASFIPGAKPELDAVVKVLTEVESLLNAV